MKSLNLSSEEEVFIAKFLKGIKKIDSNKVHKKFKDFDSGFMEFMASLETARNIVQYDLKDKDNMDKHDMNNLMFELSMELVSALKKCSNALSKYISFTNYLYKPMMLDEYKYDFEHHLKVKDKSSNSIESRDSIIEEIKLMLKVIDPIYKFLKDHNTKSYKDLEIKEIEVTQKSKEIVRKSKALDSFKTTDDKRTDYADIFIKVLRGSKKMPTMKALEIASHGKISESTWSRKMHHSEVLDKICTKLNAMTKEDSRIKNDERIKFYEDIYQTLNDRYNLMVISKLDIEKVREKALQLKSDNLYNNSQEED